MDTICCRLITLWDSKENRKIGNCLYDAILFFLCLNMVFKVVVVDL